MKLEITTDAIKYLESIIDSEQDFNSWFLNDRLLNLLYVPIIRYRYNIRKVCQATGMSYSELEKFLVSHKYNTDGKYIDHEAMEALEKWYLKKLKRYVRNGLHAEDGTDDKLLFLEFCKKYKKQGHETVKSWNDIDEERVLEDFRNECTGAVTAEPFQDEKSSLFAEIYSSILFHIKLRIARHSTLSNFIISFIISHRYHIFTTEADSNNAETTKEINKQMLNLPRSVVPYGLAS